MSCSVVVIPFALSWVMCMAAPAAALMISKEINETTEINNESMAFASADIKNNSINIANINETCNEINVISEKDFLEKSFETPFIDKEILIKTLEEHGVVNIQENEYGQIRGVVKNFVLQFERFESDKPYQVLIKHLCTENADEEFENLASEYAVNVQEECYNNIVEKLNANSMEIESEEVCDDNSIVITVNLE